MNIRLSSADLSDIQVKALGQEAAVQGNVRWPPPGDEAILPLQEPKRPAGRKRALAVPTIGA